MRKLKPVVDIPSLLDATKDLESGHPIEGILRQHGIPDRHSAYEVVKRLITQSRQRKKENTAA